MDGIVKKRHGLFPYLKLLIYDLLTELVFLNNFLLGRSYIGGSNSHGQNTRLVLVNRGEEVVRRSGRGCTHAAQGVRIYQYGQWAMYLDDTTSKVRQIIVFLRLFKVQAESVHGSIYQTTSNYRQHHCCSR